METRAKKVIECAMRVAELQQAAGNDRPVSEQIVLCLSEMGFLTAEAMNPPTEIDECSSSKL